MYLHCPWITFNNNIIVPNTESAVSELLSLFGERRKSINAKGGRNTPPTSTPEDWDLHKWLFIPGKRLAHSPSLVARHLKERHPQ